MARKVQKKNVAKEYEVIYFGDYSTKNIGGVGATLQPLFVKILRSTLTKLGGLRVFRQVPNTRAYTTKAGLTQTFFLENGVPFSRLTGILNGVNYASQSIINPPIGGNKLVLTLDKTVTSAKGEKSYEQVSIGLPSTVNVESVGKFVKDRFGDKKTVIAWKFGKVSEILDYSKLKEYKSNKPRSSGGSRSRGKTPDLEIPLYMPVGTLKVNSPVTLASGQPGKKKKNESQTIYAVIRKPSAELMGFSKPSISTEKEVNSGTKTNEKEDNAKGDRKISYSVFSSTKLYSQIWKDTEGESTSAISDAGSSTSVKLRYTKRLASTSRVVSKSEYAYFQVPAGVPVGMIALFLLNLKSRPRGFQVARGGGTQYGKSYPLPSKAGSTSRKD